MTARCGSNDKVFVTCQGVGHITKVGSNNKDGVTCQDMGHMTWCGSNDSKVLIK